MPLEGQMGYHSATTDGTEEEVFFELFSHRLRCLQEILAKLNKTIWSKVEERVIGKGSRHAKQNTRLRNVCQVYQKQPLGCACIVCRCRSRNIAVYLVRRKMQHPPKDVF